jgi:glutaminyl-tRNA synthetase
MSESTPPSNPSALNAPGGSAPAERSLHFIEQIIETDNASGKWGVWTQRDCGQGAAAAERLGKPRVHTRFPPEPNGYLHAGHAKSINLNFGLAKKYGGKFNLRFDDTNPEKEEQEYVDSIKRDVKWLGADYDPTTCPHGGGLFFASDYFEQMYQFAEELIRKGKAYVCDLSGDEVSARRGKPGVPATSPFRDRPIEESLKLFREMREGKHPNGAKSVRAKIDLASPNFNLRDPIMYRILHESHQHTGGKWCIYPMYDWAHGFEDSIEEITHSICTLEFEDHRPLYNWFIEAVNEGRPAPAAEVAPGTNGSRIHHPQQIEFAKFRPTYTVLSKRNLLKMVQSGIVNGWDDPRMPTISGMRRRGYTAESIRATCDDIGVTKMESSIDVVRLENSLRDHLNKIAPRAMAVLRPIKVIIENWPDGKVDELDYVINPEDLERAQVSGGGTETAKRKVPFSKVLYIERDDFMENPPKKFFRLAPGNEVRLRWAYIIKCVGVEKDAAGNVTEIRCTYDPATRGGDIPLGPDGKPVRKVQGTIHWVSAQHAMKAEVRLFDRLFKAEEPGKATGNYLDDLNPNSLEVVQAFVDPWLIGARCHARQLGTAVDPVSCIEGDRFQFERLGYFCVDPDSGSNFGGSGAIADKLVFNRVVTLKDSWAKEAKG